MNNKTKNEVVKNSNLKVEFKLNLKVNKEVIKKMIVFIIQLMILDVMR